MERKWHESQEITANADGSVVMTMNVPHTLDLECFVQRWAGDVKVLEGKSLRQSVGHRAEKLAAACA